MRAKEFAEQQAAGIVLYAEDTGRYGLQQRSDSINDGGLWAAWGGGRKPGESLEQCAKRELAEEGGYTGPIELKRIGENAKYVTFIGTVPKEFEPRPDNEWQDYCWVELGHWPQPLHPGVAAALQNVYIKEDTASPDYMTGHCHVMALALKKLHPDWKLKAHVGWEEEAKDDEDYRIDHVYIVAPDGSAYDCRGRFDSEQELVGPDETGGVETQFVDYTIDDIRADVARGELRPFSRADLEAALKFAQTLTENFADGKVRGKSRPGRVKRAGASCNGSVTDLRRRAKNASGERAKMYHWCANMKSGRKK